MAVLGALSGAQLALAVTLLVVVAAARELFFSPLRAFRGPVVARFTNFWRAFLTALGNVDSTTRGWHQKWGDAVRIGPNAISLSDPSLIKVVYASTSKNAWKKGDMYRVNDVVVNGQRISNIFNTQNEAFHTKFTRPIGGFWSLSKILEMEPLMDETIWTFTNKLGTAFADATSGAEPSLCMMDDWLTYFAWDFAANVSFGRHYGFIEQGKDVEGMIAESTAGLNYFATVSQIPWLDNWLDKNPVLRIGPKPLVKGLLYTVNLVADYQKKLSDGTLERRHVESFIDKYNGLKNVYDFADDNQIVHWLMANILAGGDSTAGALRPIVYYLAKRPEVQVRLQTELQGARLSVPAQWSEVKHLAYLDAVLREAARMSPAVGLMFERQVPAGGFQLPDGRFIPEGTTVGINPTVVTRDVSVFGDEVDDFRPERWLRAPQESVWNYDQRRRQMEEVTDLMFGAGSRACMGKSLAKVEMYKLIATLYTLFHINLPDVNHEWKRRNAWFMYQHDMPMVIRRRASSAATIPKTGPTRACAVGTAHPVDVDVDVSVSVSDAPAPAPALMVVGAGTAEDEGQGAERVEIIQDSGAGIAELTS
ncbi:hypothetical protein E4U43_001143 [Claviceps pusilla]|uniref:Pisatin demethylase cytochrome P450 n=1 Tax=Claviceps pusilla TaxID=123648 RepID=A0A9P7NIJ6_9HYPO|nr:hypothetical protein E4U43_001143 [Claviceps pusilla]